VWSGHLHYRDKLYPGRVGFWTGQSQQFTDPPTRGRHGGVKIEFSSRPSLTHIKAAGLAATAEEALALFEPTRRCRHISLHAESAPSDQKYVTLSKERDRFGDPCAHVQYASSDFDRRTYEYSKGLFERVAKATDAVVAGFSDWLDFSTLNHYMATCRMGKGPEDGVVDAWSRVHGSPNLYVVGLGNIVGAAGAANPALTGTALALRAADAIAAQLT